jgi:hypothetical protein
LDAGHIPGMSQYERFIVRKLTCSLVSSGSYGMLAAVSAPF